MKSEPPAPKWVRWEKWARYHAILGTTFGGFTLVTYCGRIRRVSAAGKQVSDPEERCQCCTGRIARPYLIPDEVKAGLDRPIKGDGVRLVNRPLTSEGAA